MADEQTLRLKTGDHIRIDGRLFIAGTITDEGRAFSEKATGNQIILSNRAQVRMAHEGRISSEAMFRALSAPIREAIATDWDAMTPSERETAQFRHRFVQLVELLPANKRRKSHSIQTAIDEAWIKTPSGGNKPTVRSVRRWIRIYEATGRDIRALTESRVSSRARLTTAFLDTGGNSSCHRRSLRYSTCGDIGRHAGTSNHAYPRAR